MILKSPVTIADADRPIGTHVFTAVERTADGDGLRWNVVSLRGGDTDNAKAALDRITMPQDVLGHITGIAPRASLIVTDEPPSSETGNGTEFVVLLSGEPQGGIKKRRRSPVSASRYVHYRSHPFWGSPFGSPFGW